MAGFEEKKDEISASPEKALSTEIMQKKQSVEKKKDGIKARGTPRLLEGGGPEI